MRVRTSPARAGTLLLGLLLLPLASCWTPTVAKHCDPPKSIALQLSVKGQSGGIARLLTGQAMAFSDAPDWAFRVSDGRVLKEDECPGPVSYTHLTLPTICSV